MNNLKRQRADNNISDQQLLIATLKADAEQLSNAELLIYRSQGMVLSWRTRAEGLAGDSSSSGEEPTRYLSPAELYRSAAVQCDEISHQLQDALYRIRLQRFVLNARVRELEHFQELEQEAALSIRDDYAAEFGGEP